MPIVEITLFEGRSAEAKERMMKSVTNAIVESLPAKLETVSIILREIPAEHYASGGVVAGKPKS